MNNKANFTVEFSLQDGAQETFKNKLDEAITLVKANEPGALNYQFYFNDDETKCYVMEQYADSAAMMFHLSNVSGILNEILQISTLTRLEIFGALSEEAHSFASSMGARFYTHHDGFTR